MGSSGSADKSIKSSLRMVNLNCVSIFLTLVMWFHVFLLSSSKHTGIVSMRDGHLVLSERESIEASPGIRAKRNSGSPSPGARKFIENLRSSNPVDLIVLIDRSRSVYYFAFHLHLRPFVQHILRYYTAIGQDAVRVTILTFANDVQEIFSGETSPNKNKCEIFGKPWELIQMDVGPDDGANIRVAFEHALALFRDKRRRQNAKKYIWVLTAGFFNSDVFGDYKPARDELHEEGVIIVATNSDTQRDGLTSIRGILKEDDNYGGTIQEWADLVSGMEPLEDTKRIVPFTYKGPDCYCDLTFGFTTCGLCTSAQCSLDTLDCHTNSDCVCVDMNLEKKLCTTSELKVCTWYHYQTGRSCKQHINLCVSNACPNNGTCIDQQGSYTCMCPEDFLPPYCDISKPPKGVINYIIGGSAAGAILLLIIIIVTGVVCYKRKRRQVDTREQETYTNPQTLGISTQTETGTTMETGAGGTGTQTGTTRGWGIRTQRLTNLRNWWTSRSGSTESSYLQIPTLPRCLPPRDVPTAHIRPTPKVRPPVPKKPWKKPIEPKAGLEDGYIPSMLREVPTPLKSSNVRSEILVQVQTAGNEGKDETDESDLLDYENCENVPASIGLTGWNSYIAKLTSGNDGLMAFAIVSKDRTVYATSSFQHFLPSKEEISTIDKLLQSKNRAVGSILSLCRSNYRVAENNGKMLESFFHGRHPDVLCVGRSRFYLVFGLLRDPQNSRKCYFEVNWVRNTLSGQRL